MIRKKIEESNENIKILQILSSSERAEKDITVLAILQRFDNYPVLEKRRFFYDKDGNLKTGKVMALNGEDLDTIYSNYNLIAKHIKLEVEPK